MKKFLLMITIFLCITPTVFAANDWNFEYEKDIYYKCVDLFNNSSSGDYSGYIKGGYLTGTFIENIFEVSEQILEESNYIQSDYPYCFIQFIGDGDVRFVCKQKNQTNFINSSLSASYKYSIYIEYNINSDFNITNSSLINHPYSSGVSRDFSTPNAFYLSSYPGTITVNEDLLPFYSAYADYKYYPSSNLANGVNQYNPINNFILNKEFFIGYDYNYNYNFYYLENNEKISINDYVFLSDSYFWNGTQFSPYITKENISLLQQNTNFYLDLNIASKGNSNFFKKLLENQKVFYTFYDENKGEIESGDIGSGDTGGGTVIPSGDVSGDAPNYNEKLDNIQNGINNIENKIPTSGEISEIVPSSGDIEHATQNGVVQGSTDYWGSSGDMSGDHQEELISGKVDELTEQISGDLAENEIFSILKTYEDKLFGGFTGEQDFKISWNNVSYAGRVIIPKGEVNFSEICRENETLGRVKTTINIILGFMLLYNCVIYLYNLLLATLGIDNPYLYEKPQDVTTTTITSDMTTGRKTMVTSTRKANGNTYNVRRSIK